MQLRVQSALVLLCTFLAWAAAQQNGLQLTIYNNTAVSGLPLSTAYIPTLEFTMPAAISSAEVLGTMNLDAESSYAFYCTFDGVTFAFLWIDDHIVCQTGAYMFPNITLAPSEPNLDWGQDNPITVFNRTSVPVRLHVYKVDNEGSGIDIRVLMQKAGSGKPPAPIETSRLFPSLDYLEKTRRQLQLNLVKGWGQWMYCNLLEFTLLPAGARFRTDICHLPSNTCLNQTMISRCMQPVEHPVLRMGLHAVDKSYLQYYIMWMDMNISVSYIVNGARNEDIQLLFEAVNCTGSLCDDYLVRVVGDYAWSRAGQVQASSPNQLHYDPYGLDSFDIHVLNRDARHRLTKTRDLPPTNGPYILLPLNQGPVGITTLPDATVDSVSEVLAQTEAKERARIQQWGDLAELKESIQSVIMWNMVYTPTEFGPILPPSRDWTWVVPNPVSCEWAYIMFDWDNFFGSLLAGLDSLMKDIAYSNLIQITKSRTSAGFVPNWNAGGFKTTDHSEPVVGAKVLLELYNKFYDLWIVEYLFEDLLAWNNFIWNNRRLSVGITWGSQLCTTLDCIGYARGESGMDQSPMWDCPGADPDGNGGDCSVFFDPAQHTLLLGEAGATSLYVLDCYALAELAIAINRPDVATELLRRASIIALNLDAFWDEEYSTYSNLLTNGSFYRRISPTTFYPMMVLPTNDVAFFRAQRLMDSWLTNKTRFCIDISGNWPDGSDNPEGCWWGLPSISFDDPSFYRPASYIYWRGFVWMPTAQFTYWGLQRFDKAPGVRKARLQFVNQMTSLYLEMWRNHHHVCENYGSYKNTTDCTGGQFYHWGALAALLPFFEQGRY